jgi:hypothetical protein
MDHPHRVRSVLLHRHHELLAGLLDCADQVAAGWPGDAVSRREAVVGPYRECLTAKGLLERLPRLVRVGVEAAGATLAAEPVAGPPYVVLTSEGVMLRASTESHRLVVSYEVFGIERTDTAHRYRRTADSPAAALAISISCRAS